MCPDWLLLADWLTCRCYTSFYMFLYYIYFFKYIYTYIYTYMHTLYIKYMYIFKICTLCIIIITIMLYYIMVVDQQKSWEHLLKFTEWMDGFSVFFYAADNTIWPVDSYSHPQKWINLSHKVWVSEQRRRRRSRREWASEHWLFVQVNEWVSV